MRRQRKTGPVSAASQPLYFDRLPSHIKYALPFWYPARSDENHSIGRMVLSTLPGFEYFCKPELARGRIEFVTRAALNGFANLVKWGASRYPVTHEALAALAQNGDEATLFEIANLCANWRTHTCIIRGALQKGHYELAAKLLRLIPQSEDGLYLEELFQFTWNPELVDIFFKNTDLPWGDGQLLAESGDLARVKWAVENGCQPTVEMMRGAAKSGNLELVKWLRSKGAPSDIRFWAYAAAAPKNSIRIMEFALTHRLPVDEYDWKVIEAAVVRNDLPAVEWLHLHGFRMTKEVIRKGIKKKCSVDILKYLIANGCPPNEDLLATVAAAGLLEFAKFLVIRGMKWKLWDAVSAARNGHFDVVKFAFESGYSPSKEILSAAAQGAHWEMVKWLREKGCEWEPRTSEFIAEKAPNDVWNWCIAQKMRLNSSACEGAARGGHIARLKFLRSKGVAWDAMTMAGAAEGGHLELVKFLRNSNVPWDENTACRAAHFGSLENLQWLLLNQCPAGPDVHIQAVIHNNLHVLQWAFDHGCPLHQLVAIQAVYSGHNELLEWIEGQCSCDFDYLYDTACDAGQLAQLPFLHRRGTEDEENAADEEYSNEETEETLANRRRMKVQEEEERAKKSGPQKKVDIFKLKPDGNQPILWTLPSPTPAPAPAPSHATAPAPAPSSSAPGKISRPPKKAPPGRVFFVTVKKKSL